MSEAPIFQRLSLIGVGLIGSSIARAARLTGVAGSIVATARSEATRKRVVELKLADAVVDTNAEAVAGADLVIMCIPVGACGETAREIAPNLAQGAIATAVGIGASLSQAVAGAIVHHAGYNAGFLFLAAVAAAGFTLLWLFMPETAPVERRPPRAAQVLPV